MAQLEAVYSPNLLLLMNDGLTCFHSKQLSSCENAYRRSTQEALMGLNV